MNSAGISSQQRFSHIPSANIQRSVFQRDSRWSGTFDAGKLIPFFWDEVLPGDTKQVRTGFLARLATPLRPYMDNVLMDFHFFFIPNRLVWENWERFCGAQDAPGDSTAFLVPQLDATTHAAGFGEMSLFDFFGLPTKIASVPQSRMPNALIPRAYNLVWNEWYRDENLQDPVDVDTGDGPDDTVFTVLPRGRSKDYFTGALPWPQKGPTVTIPLGTRAPVVGIGKVNGTFADSGSSYRESTGQTVLYPNSTLVGDSLGAGAQFAIRGTAAADAFPDIYANLEEATAASVNLWREAIQMQGLFERDAKGGTRYVELLLAHFGVISPDFRLQRPEYIGGGTVEFNVNPIAQTSRPESGNPQGQLAAFAQSHGTVGFNRSFVEHGHVIGLVSLRAPVTYQQGMERMWSRQTRYEFYWPAFAHLGEQAILNKELMLQGTSDDEGVYGWQERYSEMKFKMNVVTGLFRSNATGSLDSWNLALDFDTLPELADMVEENPPIDRIIAVPSQPHVLFDSYTRFRDTRAMPTFATPATLSRF